MAGNTAAANLEGYIYVSQNAFYTAALTFVGQNLGARNMERVKKSGLLCLVVCCMTGAVMGFALRTFGEPLLNLYSPGNAEVIAHGMVRLRIIGSFYFLCGLMEVGCGIMRGLGQAVLPMIVSLIGSCAFRVVWVATVFEKVGTLQSLFYSYPISWVLTGAVHFICVFFTIRSIRRRMRTAESEEEPLPQE